MTATAFQRRKLLRRFASLDLDGNGYIELADYLAIIGRMRAGFEWAADDPRLHSVRTAYEALWHQLAKADRNGDQRIDAEEFVDALAHVLLARPDGFDRALRPAAEVLFDACDADGDGTVDASELQRMLACYGIRAQDVSIAAENVLPAGGVLDRAAFLAVVKEYYCGNDASAPGSWLFGDPSPLLSEDEVAR